MVLTLASGQSEVWGLSTPDRYGEDRYPNRRWFSFLEALALVRPEVKVFATQEVLVGPVYCFIDYFSTSVIFWSRGHCRQRPRQSLGEYGVRAQGK